MTCKSWGMTDLDKWMGAERDDRWLAEVLGCHPSQAWRIRKGRSRPSPSKAYQIERLTDGAVKAADLLNADTGAEAA